MPFDRQVSGSRAWRAALAAAVLALLAAPLAAAKGGDEADACDSVQTLLPPVTDRPTAADRKRLHDCNEFTLYYGLEAPANLADARLCAMISLEASGAGGSPLHDAGLLMQIYAHGRGAQRNAAVARHYACLMQVQEETRTKILQGIDQYADGTQDYPACADAEWGVAEAECSALPDWIAIRDAKVESARFAASLDTGARAAFEPLRRAWAAYFKLRMDLEIRPPDRGRGTNETRREREFDDDIAAVIKAFRGTPIPAGDDLPQQDRTLNATYRRVLQAATQNVQDDPEGNSELTPEQLRQDERAWLAFADACERFRRVHDAGLTSDALRRLLTVQRIAALRALFYYVRIDENWRPGDDS